jgi:hypothetical protein
MRSYPRPLQRTCEVWIRTHKFERFIPLGCIRESRADCKIKYHLDDNESWNRNTTGTKCVLQGTTEKKSNGRLNPIGSGSTPVQTAKYSVALQETP